MKVFRSISVLICVLLSVLTAGGNIVSQATAFAYYLYGEPTIEPEGQRYLFGGKEREHAGGRNSYDFGARSLTPYARWSTPDPLADKNFSISPYLYCNGDPINFVDKDGKIAWPIIAAIIGGGIDLATQVSTNLIKGQSFMKALGNVDVTSVFASAATSALLGPAAGARAKIAAVTINAADAAVDANINDGIRYVGGDDDNEKEVSKVVIDFGASMLSDFGIKHTEFKTSSSGKSSAPETGTMKMTKEEMDRTTKIVLKINADGAKEGIDQAKGKNKNTEPTDAIKPNPQPIKTITDEELLKNF